MLGRTAGRIGADLYPPDGPANGIWRLSELYNEYRFRFWPPELVGCRSTLNLTAGGTFIEFVGGFVKFDTYKTHTISHVKFDLYKLSGGIVS